MSTRGVSLLAYADRLGGDLRRLQAVLDGPLADLTGVHILPFYTPFDGDDAGFDPVDHTAVDPRLGRWSDLAAIGGGRELTADIIVNHSSALSPEFLDWTAHGTESRFDGMFLRYDAVFPSGASEADITAFYRPRPGLPFTPYAVAGERRLIWTTFMPSQVDLDLRHPAALAYLDRIVGALAQAGVDVVRLDAVGYAVKTPGTSSFMTEHTLAFVEELAARLRGAGLRVLVEVHAHHSQQIAIAPLVDLVYDFASAPLMLHALGDGDIAPLLRWLELRPANAVTVLDTHDGIGIIDAGPAEGLPGLIDEDQMRAIFERAADATAGHSDLASVVPQWASMPHQINATFPSVVADDEAYVLCRAVQVMLPGEPQFYYVGLLDGRDDEQRFLETGQGREVNRHVYDDAELSAAVARPVPRALLGLARLRRDHPAFDGDFGWMQTGPTSLRLQWQSADELLVLDADFAPGARQAVLTSERDGERRILHGAAGLAAI
ncbi:alpha-amylase family glycosyl hydrolase [Naasia lichenicola]|uniref:Sucrose phosphorylase n=1 Tax=Naasia lichenicola TaxID=2565933 RepID=A0A4S4FJ77_9MICO|nr:alpha-amylase family glycosyl hydrolase [Naasia lichenicola]THG29265.1 sucrose phosphorylase [Naasia lichenicola]